MDKFKTIITSVLVVAFSFFMWGASQTLTALKTIQEQNLGTGIQETSCTASTTKMVIGDDESVLLLASSSRRAFAAIAMDLGQNPLAASNTVSVAFQLGTPATLSNGFILATETPEVTFGLNTPFPYTGRVTGITSNSSTTIKVTQCVY